MTKIAFVGAGSLTFTRALVRDILTFPLLEDATLALMDINAERLELARAFVDYVGSLEGQLLAARQSYRNITRTDVPADSLPDWLVEVNRRLQPMELDWDLLETRESSPDPRAVAPQERLDHSPSGGRHDPLRHLRPC